MMKFYGAILPGPGQGNALGTSGTIDRNGHREAAPGAKFTAHAHLAAVGLSHLFDYGQPEAGTATAMGPGPVGAVKPLEDTRQMLG